MALRRFLRENTFLVAAVMLPLVVVGFFLLSTAIPRFTVPPPAHDLLLSANSYDQPAPRVSVEFTVREDRVYATVRPLPANSYAHRQSLWLFDHSTMNVRQIPLDLPEQLDELEPSRTVLVGALAGRRVLAQTKAPDGYELRSRAGGSPGLFGDLFGMRRYDYAVTLVNRGRVVAVALPSPYQYQSPTVIGWLGDEGTR